VAAIQFTVNAKRVDADVEPSTLLIDLLRGPLALTGTHNGCDTMQCGACTVLVDGEAVRSCSMLAVQAQGRQVTTVEGLGSGQQGSEAGLSPVQRAFRECHALQCGFCTPGFLTTITAGLIANPAPSRDDAVEMIAGNLCRCTGYHNIVDAVLRAAELIGETTSAPDHQAAGK